MRALPILSPQNPMVKQARALWQKKNRDETGLFLCEGEHMVGEAIVYASKSVVSVIVDENRLSEYQTHLDRLDARTRLFSATSRIMALCSQVKTPQGIAAIVEKPAPALLVCLGDRILMLDNVQDPGNVGTMLRTLDAAGFTGVILTEGCADLFGDKALRATMGSVFRVPYRVTDSAENDLGLLEKLGYSTVAAALDGEPFYNRQSLNAKLCLVIGNEGAGIRESVKSACTEVYRLPMVGQAESLNAAVAAAVMMYDLVNR